MLSDRYPVSLSVTLVYCGQTVGWIKMAVDGCRTAGVGGWAAIADKVLLLKPITQVSASALTSVNDGDGDGDDIGDGDECL